MMVLNYAERQPCGGNRTARPETNLVMVQKNSIHIKLLRVSDPRSSRRGLSRGSLFQNDSI